jgi:2-hydroxychromene-2-carboxylate isomerase
MAQLEFFFDVVSPYTYFAAHRLVNDQRYAAVEVKWTPFFLGGLMKLASNRPPAEVPAKGLYMMKDLMRLGAYYGVQIQFPAVFPANTLMHMRAATALQAQNAPQFKDYCMRMFKAYWSESLDITDPAVWTRLVTELGIDAETLRGAAENPAYKETLKANTQRAADLGAFGAPTFLLGEELYWGFDRMFLIERALGIDGVKA